MCFETGSGELVIEHNWKFFLEARVVDVVASEINNIPPNGVDLEGFQ